jgi:tricarballylate dehydrogenase
VAAAGSGSVVVVGGGNAGICAAISARRAGAEVRLIERNAQVMRGGNSRHTRDIRYAHAQPDRFSNETYPPDELLADLRGVADERSDSAMADILAHRSIELPDWMTEQGVAWQDTLHGALHLSRTNAFFLGGGRALLNTYYATAEKLGVRITYETDMVALKMDGSRCTGLVTRRAGREVDVAADAFVMAAGGIEANLAWLHEAWGDAADNFIIRGSPANDGTVLLELLRNGAAAAGDGRNFHSVGVDARSPRFDGGIVTRVDAVPYGIAVNRAGRRFHDEGETFWPKRYAIWGKLIAGQPDQAAWVIFDELTRPLFIPPLYPPIAASTIAELAERLQLPVDAVVATVTEFNEAPRAPATFDPGTLDGLATHALEPPKSNWAVSIDHPPFYAYPLRPGITFTYYGVRVDATTRVQRSDGAFDNVFAAGELMAGNILTRGYLAGVGLTIGTVFGRIAGEEAARAARRAD